MIKILYEELYWVISDEDSKKFLEDNSAGVSDGKELFFYATMNPKMATHFSSRELAVKFLQTWAKRLEFLELNCVEKHADRTVAED